MSAPDDGGMAFPCQPLNGQGFPEAEMQRGLSIRDYFAGQALAGGMANPSDGHLKFSYTDEELINLAELYYRMADAMVEARKGGSDL